MSRVDTAYPQLRKRRRAATRAALGALLAAQAEDVTARESAGLTVLLTALWDARLADVLFTENRVTAREVGQRVAQAISDGDPKVFDPDVLDDWLRANADGAAKQINDATRAKLDEAAGAVAVAEVMEAVQGTGAAKYAATAVTGAVGFAAMDAARAEGASAKVWRTNSGNPRSAHRAVNGEAVPIDGEFRNGMEWPGDWSGGPAEVINCQCSLTLL